MTRIKIQDLPRDTKISREEMRKVLGGNIALDKYVSLSEENLSTTGNDAQLADLDQLYQFEIQVNMQQVQQAMQMMSNIMKQQNDTLQSIVKNMK
jgi:hypothetical protein